MNVQEKAKALPLSDEWKCFVLSQIATDNSRQQFRPDSELLGFLDLETLVESFVAPDEFDLVITLGFGRLGEALLAAESNFGVADLGLGVLVQITTAEWALGLFRLSRLNQLHIGASGVLGGVLLECIWTTTAAEVNLRTAIFG